MNKPKAEKEYKHGIKITKNKIKKEDLLAKIEMLEIRVAFLENMIEKKAGTSGSY